MPSLTTTIEENSPLITYLSGWVTGTSADGAASRYSGSSFMATQTAGASASFTFNGTGVQIFGAKRGNHGSYVVQVDEKMYPAADGSAPDPGLYQQNLFTVEGLKQGRHEVRIINQGTTSLDVDFITWTTGIGKPSDKLFVSTVLDTDPAFVYSSAWDQNPKNVGSFLGGSGHATTRPGASFVYTFQRTGPGQGVSLYGPVGPDGAPYTVALDDAPPQAFTSNKALYKSQVLLYHANNLPLGQHRLKVACQPTSSGQVFAVDYMTVYSTSPPSQSVKEAGLSAGSIVGITLSFVGILGVLAALFLFLRRRRQRQQQYQDELGAQFFNTVEKQTPLQAQAEAEPEPEPQTQATTTSTSSPDPTSNLPIIMLTPTSSLPIVMPTPTLPIVMPTPTFRATSRTPPPISRSASPVPVSAWRKPSLTGEPKQQHQVRFSEPDEDTQDGERSSSERLVPPSLPLPAYRPSSPALAPAPAPASSSMLFANSTIPRRGLPPRPSPRKYEPAPAALPRATGHARSSSPSSLSSLGSPFADVHGVEGVQREGGEEALPPYHRQVTPPQPYTR
ncbi:hypothetical protein D9615_002669 [Tricholomella constricta]|uniref:Transmembrane protein n=1 Tax=Tricholomella constricta TaxID=117010 RepID=A0A8H5M9Q6_9AGAR|nr:hypothetical protein D9615_002669 [Tricholomella constricta]